VGGHRLNPAATALAGLAGAPIQEAAEPSSEPLTLAAFLSPAVIEQRERSVHLERRGRDSKAGPARASPRIASIASPSR